PSEAHTGRAPRTGRQGTAYPNPRRSAIGQSRPVHVDPPTGSGPSPPAAIASSNRADWTSNPREAGSGSANGSSASTDSSPVRRRCHKNVRTPVESSRPQLSSSCPVGLIESRGSSSSGDAGASTSTNSAMASHNSPICSSRTAPASSDRSDDLRPARPPEAATGAAGTGGVAGGGGEVGATP